MTSINSLIRPHISQMPAYEPVLPFEVRSQQLGLEPDQIIKLDANENPYGPVPAVSQTLAQYPYPTSTPTRNAVNCAAP